MTEGTGAEAEIPVADRSSADVERPLYAFGPLGVAVGRTPPGIFRVVLRNMVRVVLTDRRLCGVRRPPWIARVFGAKERLEFEVPLREIVSLDVRHVAAAKALWVRHRAHGEVRDVTVETAAFLHHHVDRLRELLGLLLPGIGAKDGQE